MSRFDDAAKRLEPRTRALQDPADAGEADHRLGAGAAGQRRGGGLHRLPGALQHLARTREGRHPLRPASDAGRGEGAGRLDDLEVRGGQHSVRRRQGRRHLRSAARMSNAELERLTRRYTSAIIDTLGPDSDVPAPDVNTNERVMAWIMDTYSMHKRHTVTAVVTGKPIEMGGSLGRREATGRGCMIVTREALKKLRHAAQGNPGRGAGLRQRRIDRGGARWQEQGMTIVAVSDKSGGHLQSARASTSPRCSAARPGAAAARASTRTPSRSPTSSCSRSTATCWCRRRSRTSSPARTRGDIKAKIICEGANGPTTAAADKILEREGRLRHPGHPGQRRRRHGQLLRVGAGPRRLLLGRGDGEQAAREDHGPLVRGSGGHGGHATSVDIRIGAYMLAIERVAAVHRLRGMYA